MRRTRGVIGAVLAGVCLPGMVVSSSGCFEVDQDLASSEEAELQRFTRTVVELSSDGNHRVTVYSVEPAAQAAQRDRLIRAEDGEEELGTSQDAIEEWACTSSAMQIFDDTDYYGNELCLVGTGVVHLSEFCRTYFHGICIDAWSNNPRSFKWGLNAKSWIANENNLSCLATCDDTGPNGPGGSDPEGSECERTNNWVVRAPNCSMM